MFIVFYSCRWAQHTTELNECGDVCQATPNVELYEDCTVIFNSTGKIVGKYAISLMVEDFDTESANTSYSKVPIQFLIEIINSSSCSSKPIIDTTLPSYTPIQICVATPFNFTVTITNKCSGRYIQELTRVPPLNMFKRDIVNSSSADSYTVTETWVPTVDQIGLQIYCAVATDKYVFFSFSISVFFFIFSYDLQSDIYCVMFMVVSEINSTMLCK